MEQPEDAQAGSGALGSLEKLANMWFMGAAGQETLDTIDALPFNVGNAELDRRARDMVKQVLRNVWMEAGYEGFQAGKKVCAFSWQEPEDAPRDGTPIVGLGDLREYKMCACITWYGNHRNDNPSHIKDGFFWSSPGLGARFVLKAWCTLPTAELKEVEALMREYQWGKFRTES